MILPHLRVSLLIIGCCLLLSIGGISTAPVAWGEPQPTAGEEPFHVDSRMDDLLLTYCYTCHEAGVNKGDVRLDNLEKLSLDDRLALMDRMQEQVYVKNMPPVKKAGRNEPTDSERQEIFNWLSAELNKHGAAKFEKKLQRPDYGNYVDHEMLFSGEYKDLPGFTYDRRWLISEYIFNAKFQRLLSNRTTAKKGGNNVTVVGSHKFYQFSVTNPFLLPTNSGVRYFADTDLNGGHLSTMLTNAQKTSEYITGYMVKKNKKYLPAIAQIMELQDTHQATLDSRRLFMEQYISRLCEDYYGNKNESMLPKFVPVKLNAREAIEDGEDYKKAPIHVAIGTLEKLDAINDVYQVLFASENTGKSDDQLRDLCERKWFFEGDFERDIQGRMAILRDYLPEVRESLAKSNRYKQLAYKPLADDEMQVVRDAIMKHRARGDYYDQLIDKCLNDWEQEFKQRETEAGPPSDELLTELISQLFVQILERSPGQEEREAYLAQMKSYIETLGNLKGIQKLIQTLILSSEFVYREEIGTGEADAYGRRMLSPRDASYAIAYALTDQSPDEQLVQAAETGRLQTREDYKREVTRILKKRDVNYLIDPILEDRNFPQNTTNTAIRKLRFFREFFGYPEAIRIFKDEKRFGGDRLENATARLLSETDRIVEHILEKDRNVFEELLTTDEFFVYHDGDNDRMQARSDTIRSIYEHFKDTDWKNFNNEDLLKHRDFLKEVKMRTVDPDKLDARNRQGTTLQLFKESMRTITARMDKGQKAPAPFDLYRGYGNDFMLGYNVGRFYNFQLDNWDYETIQPAKVANRSGILTSPAWLIAHAKNTETDPVHRGKWVREKLLAGTIPDVPITVDAVIPEDHSKTLRDRLSSVTENSYCWNCHVEMNPLGNAFEYYDDFGRFRTEESLEYPDKLVKEGPKNPSFIDDSRDIYQTLPVNARGFLKGTGDASLDGEVDGAIDLTRRLAKSQRVRQSIIRYAFRYFLGRNETLSDSNTLIEAEQAYVESDGSFDAMVISLLTSDSFIYRKAIEED